MAQSEQMIAGTDTAYYEVVFAGGLCQTRICGIFRKCASVVITAKPYCIADAAIQIVGRAPHGGFVRQVGKQKRGSI
jgi:hypothetical protein